MAWSGSDGLDDTIGLKLYCELHQEISYKCW
jgi:hypothetical protein